jgi:hypothetical protein
MKGLEKSLNISLFSTKVLEKLWKIVPCDKKGLGVVVHSKIPWCPKLLFQRENALASF